VRLSTERNSGDRICGEIEHRERDRDSGEIERERKIEIEGSRRLRLTCFFFHELPLFHGCNLQLTYFFS